MSENKITTEKNKHQFFFCKDIDQRYNIFTFYSKLFPVQKKIVTVDKQHYFIIDRRNPEQKLTMSFFKRGDQQDITFLMTCQNIDFICIDQELFLNAMRDNKDPLLQELIRIVRYKYDDNNKIKLFTYNPRKNLISIF